MKAPERKVASVSSVAASYMLKELRKERLKRLRKARLDYLIELAAGLGVTLMKVACIFLVWLFLFITFIYAVMHYESCSRAVETVGDVLIWIPKKTGCFIRDVFEYRIGATL